MRERAIRCCGFSLTVHRVGTYNESAASDFEFGAAETDFLGGCETMVQKKTGKKYAGLLPGAAGLLAAGYLALCAAVDGRHMLPGTKVNGIDLGGMTYEEAVGALRAEEAACRQEAILTISFGGKEYQVDAGNGLEFDHEGTAAEALKLTKENFFLRGAFFLRGCVSGFDCRSFSKVDSDRLYDAVCASGILQEDGTIQTSYKEENGKLVFSVGTPGDAVDEAGLMEALLNAIEAGTYETVLPAPVCPGVVEPVDLPGIYEEIHTDPVNAALDPEAGYQVLPSVTGVDFDLEQAEKMLGAAQEGSTVVIDLIYTEPEITAQDMEERMFRDRLASFTTRVSSNENYIHNVRLAAEKCDGIILLPGEEFSFNRTVGEQTAETGFLKASATKGTQVIQAYGGGICQVSSVLFMAALYSGLDIPERWCHTFVTSYLDPGLDAAVAWGVLDFRIENNRDYPVRLEVRYKDRNLNAVIWGTKTEDTFVEVETKVQEETEELLKVRTCRKTWSSDGNHVFIEQITDSEYIRPGFRVD